MNQMPSGLVKHMKQILFASVLINAALFIFFSIGYVPVSDSQMYWYGGIFLMLFACTHGWYRYGLYKMILFFCITTLIAWLLESFSISTGIPFGRFVYTELLGEKLGLVPIMIFPAYFFNGYLAWSMAGIFCGQQKTGISRRHLIRIPLIASLLMVAWNACFDPILSSLKGYWIWRSSGIYFGVPLSNFMGWFITTYLIFQLFALILYRYDHDEPIEIDRYFWILIPVMYATQALPYLIYPLFRSQGREIYRPIALITVFVMILPAVLNFLVYFNSVHLRLRHDRQ